METCELELYLRAIACTTSIPPELISTAERADATLWLASGAMTAKKTNRGKVMRKLQSKSFRACYAQVGVIWRNNSLSDFRYMQNGQCTNSFCTPVLVPREAKHFVNKALSDPTYAQALTGFLQELMR